MESFESFAKDLFEDTQPTNEGEGEYSTELYTNKAVQRIRSHNASHPMFLYVAFQAISLLKKKIITLQTNPRHLIWTCRNRLISTLHSMTQPPPLTR